MTRYLRLFGSFARVSLLGEMAFRANFLLKMVVEITWLGLMLYFYRVLFEKTDGIAGWSKQQYFFFIGVYYVIEALNEALFLGNFGEFSELVRKGDLDLVLLKPADEQFLVSFRHVEWSTLPSAIFGCAIMVVMGRELNIGFDPWRIGAFIVGLVCALGMAYSFLLMLASTSVWLVRNQSLYELWWLFMSLMRYPKEIFQVPWAAAVGWFFTFIVPVVLAINVPAASMVKVLEPGMVIWLAVATTILLLTSRWVFRRALRSYRSASG